MKVFSHYPSKKIWQFSIKLRMNDNTFSSVSACVYSTLNDTGVGIVSVYLALGFARTFFEIDEIGSTLSYIYEKTSWRESDRNGTNSRTK